MSRTTTETSVAWLQGWVVLDATGDPLQWGRDEWSIRAIAMTRPGATVEFWEAPRPYDVTTTTTMTAVTDQRHRR